MMVIVFVKVWEFTWLRARGLRMWALEATFTNVWNYVHCYKQVLKMVISVLHTEMSLVWFSWVHVKWSLSVLKVGLLNNTIFHYTVHVPFFIGILKNGIPIFKVPQAEVLSGDLFTTKLHIVAILIVNKPWTIVFGNLNLDICGQVIWKIAVHMLPLFVLMNYPKYTDGVSMVFHYICATRFCMNYFHLSCCEYLRLY